MLSHCLLSFLQQNPWELIQCFRCSGVFVSNGFNTERNKLVPRRTYIHLHIIHTYYYYCRIVLNFTHTTSGCQYEYKHICYSGSPNHVHDEMSFFFNPNRETQCVVLNGIPSSKPSIVIEISRVRGVSSTTSPSSVFCLFRYSYSWSRLLSMFFCVFTNQD